MIAGISGLQRKGRLMGAPGEFRILFAPGRGGRIDLLQLRDGKRRLLRVWPGEAAVKIAKLRLLRAQALDDQTDLQAPVAQVNVANGVIARKR